MVYPASITTGIVIGKSTSATPRTFNMSLLQKDEERMKSVKQSTKQKEPKQTTKQITKQKELNKITKHRESKQPKHIQNSPQSQLSQRKRIKINQDTGEMSTSQRNQDTLQMSHTSQTNQDTPQMSTSQSEQKLTNQHTAQHIQTNQTSQETNRTSQTNTAQPIQDTQSVPDTQTIPTSSQTTHDSELIHDSPLSQLNDRGSPSISTANYGSKTPSGNARIFKCKTCNRAFTREEHLTRHTLSTHNKLKPFSCGICSRPFSRRDLLLRHAKNLHQGSELAVSRLRRSYKKGDDDDDDEFDEDDDAEDEDEVTPMVHHRSVADRVGTSRQPLSFERATSSSSSSSSTTNSDTKHPDYETPEKKRMKMSVNMLVS